MTLLSVPAAKMAIQLNANHEQTSADVFPVYLDSHEDSREDSRCLDSKLDIGKDALC
jgi:hypothetical protein